MMCTWYNFEWFALVSIVLWAAGAGVALFARERRRWAILLTGLGTLVFAVFIVGFWIYMQRPPLRTMGGNPSMVLLLHGCIRTVDLHTLEIPLDSQLLDGCGDGLRPHQHPEAGDPRPDTDARPTEPVVHPACHGLHVLLLRAGMCLHFGLYGAHQALGRLSGGDRQAGLHRTGLSDRRDAHRIDLGQGGLGTLLELGSEGDVGCGDMGGVSVLCPPAPLPQERFTSALLDTDCLLPCATDVLVWGQLPAGGPTECSHVFTFLVI